MPRYGMYDPPYGINVVDRRKIGGDKPFGDRDADGVAGMVRRLTPRECERLQGYPDDWTALEGIADSARYRMLGNSVAVPVVEWIMRRISP